VPKDFFEKRGISMLKSMRHGAKAGVLKFILLGFMTLAVGGLVLTDVGGFFRGGVSNSFVAKGSGIEISTVQFDRTVRRVLSRQGMSPQEAYRLGLINQILNSEIQNLILTKEAQKLGLQVSDETVKNQIAKLAAPLAQGGVSKSDALKQVLRTQGVSEGEFVAAIRQEMGNTLFRSALLSGTASISDSEARDLYQFQNESRDFQGFVLSDTYAKGVEKPSDENLQKYYEANKIDFLIPERRDITIATLKKEMIAKNVEITDDELRAVYEDNIHAYEKPEQRKLEQAILSSQTEAQDIFDAVKEGKSLKDAVKKVTGAQTAYLGENDFTQSGLLEDVAKPAFEAKQGDVLGPIQTSLGFHVITLKEIIKPETDSFDKVKAALKDQIMQDRLAEDLIQAANEMDDKLAGGAPLDEVVKEMGLTTESIKGINQAGSTSGGKDALANYQGDKAQILENAFDYDAGEASPVLELEDGRYITVHVDTVTERSYTPYDSVKADLEKRWMEEHKRLANQARVEDLFAKIKTGTSLAEAAKEVGAVIQNFKDLKRDQEAKAPLTQSALHDIFEAPKDEVLKLSNPEGFVIGAVNEIHLPDTKNADKAVEELKKKAAEAMPQEVLTQYINALADKYNVKINDRVLQTIYGETQTN